LEVTLTGFESAPYGIGVRKDSTDLRGALEEAVRTLIDNGTYADILEEWNLTSGSVE
jgi:polar amino acid transport system substrate-binding protein